MKRKSDSQVIHAHDKFVRTVMADVRVAREFFLMHLPEEISHVVNLEKLQLQQRSYVDTIGNESVVDILYQTTIAGHEAYLYLLLEHQSTPDELMSFRMLKYTCDIIAQHLKNTKKKTIPLVYPMVIYHAERKYPYILQRGELKDKQAFFELVNTEISPEVGGTIMSLAEQLKAEGIAEGIAKRDIEIVRRLLAEGVDIAFIAKITGLSVTTIKENAEKTFSL